MLNVDLMSSTLTLTIIICQAFDRSHASFGIYTVVEIIINITKVSLKA